MEDTKKRNFSIFSRCYKDVLVGAVLLLIFVLIIIGAQSTQLLVLATITAKFWPTVIGIIGCVLSVVLIAQGFISGRKLALLENSESAVSEKGEKLFEGGNRRTILTFLLVALYIISITLLGWILSTLVYLFLQISLLTEKAKRKPLRIAIITVIFTAIVYVLFRYAFMLMLPPGTIWQIWR